MGQGYIYDSVSAANEHTSVLGLVTGGHYALSLGTATIESTSQQRWSFEYKRGRVEVICHEVGRDVPEIFLVHPAALFTRGFTGIPQNGCIPLISQNSGEQILLRLNKGIVEIQSFTKDYVVSPHIIRPVETKLSLARESAALRFEMPPQQVYDTSGHNLHRPIRIGPVDAHHLRFAGTHPTDQQKMQE